MGNFFTQYDAIVSKLKAGALEAYMDAVLFADGAAKLKSFADDDAIVCVQPISRITPYAWGKPRPSNEVYLIQSAAKDPEVAENLLHSAKALLPDPHHQLRIVRPAGFIYEVHIWEMELEVSPFAPA